MSYALITEAWKINEGDKLKERDFKQRPSVNRIIEPFDNIEKFPSPSSQLSTDQPDALAYQYYQDFAGEDDIDYDSDDELECKDVLEHIKTCKVCQSKIIKDQAFTLSDNVLDMLLYTITGIFILFLLDIVLRIGKNLT